MPLLRVYVGIGARCPSYGYNMIGVGARCPSYGYIGMCRGGDAPPTGVYSSHFFVFSPAPLRLCVKFSFRYPSRIGGFGAGQSVGIAVGRIVAVGGQGPTLPTQILKRFVTTTEP